MASDRLTVGEIEILSLSDCVNPIDVHSLFPEERKEADPALLAGRVNPSRLRKVGALRRLLEHASHRRSPIGRDAGAGGEHVSPASQGFRQVADLHAGP